MKFQPSKGQIGILLIITMFFYVMSAMATDWDEGESNAPMEQTQTQTQDASSTSSATISGNTEVTFNNNEQAFRTIIGGASISSYTQVTAECIAPKTGGVLKRGANFLGLFSVDRALEVNSACIGRSVLQATREHEYRMELVQLERDKVALQRATLDNCFQCEVLK